MEREEVRGRLLAWVSAVTTVRRGDGLVQFRYTGRAREDGGGMRKSWRSRPVRRRSANCRSRRYRWITEAKR
jgi:hypothetical protein